MVPEKDPRKPKLAIVSTEWRQNSHSEHMGDCFMHGWGLGGVWHEPAVEIVSMCELSHRVLYLPCRSEALLLTCLLSLRSVRC